MKKPCKFGGPPVSHIELIYRKVTIWSVYQQTVESDKTFGGHCILFIKGREVNRIRRGNSQSDIQGIFTINKIQGSFWRKLRKWNKMSSPWLLNGIEFTQVHIPGSSLSTYLHRSFQILFCFHYTHRTETSTKIKIWSEYKREKNGTLKPHRGKRYMHC